MNNYLNNTSEQSDFFNYENVRISSHVYDSLLLRLGLNEKEALFEFKCRGFRRISRYDELIVKNPYLIDKFNSNPKSNYFVNEYLNVILVVADDDLNPGNKALVTCLFINDYMIDRYNLAA